MHEVHKDGAADKDGRLKPGDYIVSVDGKAMQDCSHKGYFESFWRAKNKQLY